MYKIVVRNLDESEMFIVSHEYHSLGVKVYFSKVLWNIFSNPRDIVLVCRELTDRGLWYQLRKI